jgi:integration host factor subunit beta
MVIVANFKGHLLNNLRNCPIRWQNHKCLGEILKHTREHAMTKADLIAVIEKQANLPHHQAEKIVNICFDSMIQALFDDERIEIRGFGSFANRNYKAYEGRNPKTGKVVKVSPKKVPFFKVGKELKEMVDEGKDKYVIREA